jgi:hypothetical protein
VVALLYLDGDDAAFVAILSTLLISAWMLIEAAILGFATWLEALYAALTALIGALSFVFLHLGEGDDADARSESVTRTGVANLPDQRMSR